ncbi:Zinc finger protein ZAT9 [Linum grandiflorum]
MKQFRSKQALISHRRICSLNNKEEQRIFQCPYCFKVFGSGQALGGHKRSHLSSRTGSYPSAVDRYPPPPPPPPHSTSKSCSLWDLNLPAAAEQEDEEFSVVSDA